MVRPLKNLFCVCLGKTHIIKVFCGRTTKRGVGGYFFFNSINFLSIKPYRNPVINALNFGKVL